MTSLIRRFALVICMLAVGAQAGAQVELLSQSRSVAGDGTLGDWNGFAPPQIRDGYTLIATDADSISAPDFGLFEEEISIDLSSDSPFGTLVSVTQASEIQTGHFSIHGSVAVTASWWPEFCFPAGWCTESVVSGVDSGANSHFEVLFEVSTPTSFSLAGSLASTQTGTDLSDPPWNDVGTPDLIVQIASLQLDRDGVPYLSFSAAAPWGGPGEAIAAVSEVGILEPGTYTLTVYASTYSQFWGGYDNNNTVSSFNSFDIDFFLETPVATDEMAWGQLKALYR